MLDEWFFELQRLKNEGLMKGKEKDYTMDCKPEEWFVHLKQEFEEVEELSRENFYYFLTKQKLLKELADLSNVVDLIFEEIYKR